MYIFARLSLAGFTSLRSKLVQAGDGFTLVHGGHFRFSEADAVNEEVDEFEGEGLGRSQNVSCS